jgi:hypothetical protein
MIVRQAATIPTDKELHQRFQRVQRLGDSKGEEFHPEEY